ncbi:MAG: hypothetical protein JXA13_13635 [Anaerolineales bacterium]|nr:hypothetical protein [Anaerolineales bacterium]
MQAPRAYWSHWAKLLHAWKLDYFTAWFLEAGGPFILLGAQAIYLSEPFWGNRQTRALAHMLENGAEIQAFSDFLREEYDS